MAEMLAARAHGVGSTEAAARRAVYVRRGLDAAATAELIEDPLERGCWLRIAAQWQAKAGAA